MNWPNNYGLTRASKLSNVPECWVLRFNFFQIYSRGSVYLLLYLSLCIWIVWPLASIKSYYYTRLQYSSSHDIVERINLVHNPSVHGRHAWQMCGQENIGTPLADSGGGGGAQGTTKQIPSLQIFLLCKNTGFICQYCGSSNFSNGRNVVTVSSHHACMHTYTHIHTCTHIHVCIHTIRTRAHRQADRQTDIGPTHIGPTHT